MQELPHRKLESLPGIATALTCSDLTSLFPVCPQSFCCVCIKHFFLSVEEMIWVSVDEPFQKMFLTGVDRQGSVYIVILRNLCIVADCAQAVSAHSEWSGWLGGVQCEAGEDTA